ncbi:hypothetical protein Fcan01_27023 [Folsomia candida]|uniref:Uncharacterized protein n=1 Tax=Folsomia candida TaxID=158441 RepID=A0A226CZZ6_FOLCA|nr:hypothetical protein Fcan01_27023 [Folsomia candida]
MTASIIVKLELSNQLDLLHNHLIETCQVIQDFLEIENGVGPTSSENLNLKQTLYKFVTQMSSFTSNVTSLQVKLNKYQADDGDPKPYHSDVIEKGENMEVKVKNRATLSRKIRKETVTSFHPGGCKIKMQELEVVASDEEGDDDEECEEEEDLLPYEMEEVEPFPVGEEGYDEHEEEDDFDFNYDEYPAETGSSPPEYEYDMHPVQVEYSTPPNLPAERKSSSRKQIIGLILRNIDETPIVQKPKPLTLDPKSSTFLIISPLREFISLQKNSKVT